MDSKRTKQIIIKSKIKEIFSVYIENTKYNVYDIEDKRHDGYNDMPATWWLYFDKVKPGFIPSIDSENWTPFDIGIKRHLWEFDIKQTNTHKIKWEDNRFSNNIRVDMICNKKKIYSFGTFDINFAFSKIQYLMVVISEHPYNFYESEKELGRKIFFYGLPSTVKPSDAYPGEISIVPEYSDELPLDVWWDEYSKRKNPVISSILPEEDTEDYQMEEEQISEHKDYGSINWGDALSDGNIDWFRS